MANEMKIICKSLGERTDGFQMLNRIDCEVLQSLTKDANGNIKRGEMLFACWVFHQKSFTFLELLGCKKLSNKSLPYDGPYLCLIRIALGNFESIQKINILLEFLA